MLSDLFFLETTSVILVCYYLLRMHNVQVRVVLEVIMDHDSSTSHNPTSFLHIFSLKLYKIRVPLLKNNLQQHPVSFRMD